MEPVMLNLVCKNGGFDYFSFCLFRWCRICGAVFAAHCSAHQFYWNAKPMQGLGGVNCSAHSVCLLCHYWAHPENTRMLGSLHGLGGAHCSAMSMRSCGLVLTFSNLCPPFELHEKTANNTTQIGPRICNRGPLNSCLWYPETERGLRF